MSDSDLPSESKLGSADVAPAPRMTEVSPGLPRLFWAEEAILTLFMAATVAWLVAPAGSQIWWIAASPAIVYSAYRFRSKFFWNRLAEPIVRLSSTTIRPGQEILVECELHARSTATVRHVDVGFQSDESYGEDSQTESYGVVTLSLLDAPIGPTPIVVQQRLRAPTSATRRWQESALDWYITLRVEVEGGLTVWRRYRIEM